MSIVMFGGDNKRLASQRTASQSGSTGMGVAASCCGGALLLEVLGHFIR